MLGTSPHQAATARAPIAGRLDARRTAWGALLAAVVALTVPFGSADAQAAAGCSSAATSFAAAAVTGSVTDADPGDCFDLEGVSAGDAVAVRVLRTTGAMSLRWSVQDHDGNVVCEDFYLGENPSCTLSGTPGWRLIVGEQYDADWPGTTSFSASVRRTNTSTGCADLNSPASLSFTAPRTNGSVPSAMGVSCYAFTRGTDDPDESVWVRTDRTSGTMQPRWRLYGPSGAVECSGGGLAYSRCELRASGAHRIVVDDSGSGTGSFFLAVTRTSARAGCTDIGSTAFDSSPMTGSIGSPGEVDCYSLTNVSGGDRLRIGTQEPKAEWVVIDGAGQAICWSSYERWQDCSLSGSRGWAIVVFNQNGEADFSYGLAARGVSNPAGCSDLGATGTWSFTRARTNGSLATGLAERCYSFTRGESDPDDTAWISAVRTSGNVTPAWHLYDQQGNEVCNGAGANGYLQCELRAPGRHTIVVEDRYAASGGAFYLSAYRVSARTGCSPGPSAAFGSTPTSGALAAAGEVDCLDLPQAADGDRLDVRVTDGAWVLVDGAGSPVCSGNGRAECSIGGARGWSLLVYDSAGTRTFTYSAAALRLNDPAGCGELGAPDLWSFTSPRVTGSIAGPSRPRCYRFDRSAEEADGIYLLRAIRTSGNLDPAWRVYGPAGRLECSNADWWTRLCSLRSAGAHTVVVDDSAGAESGSFALSADRITDPSGCASIRSVTQGVPKSSGRLGAAGEVDCFVIPSAPDDQFTFTASGSADRLTLVGPNGDVACTGWGSFACTTAGQGPYLALVDSGSGTATGSYTFEAGCENVPCGVADTAILDVTPSSIGAGSQSSVLLRGRDLDLLQSVRFVRGSTTLAGRLDQAAADGRTRVAQLDTGTAEAGGYRLIGEFLDGSTREIADALTVTAAKPAQVHLSLVGREAFRVGTSTTVTVQATNTGNVDARGVTMIVGGFPAGSTIAVEGGVTQISGTKGAPQYRVQPFDQEKSSITTDNGIVAPFLIPRVPASSSVQIKFSVTVPTNTTYKLRVVGGECMDQPVPGSTGSSRTTRAATSGDKCAYGLLKLATTVGEAVLPGKECANLALEAFNEGVFSLGTSTNPVTLDNAIGFGIGGAKCAADVFPPTKVVKSVLKVASALWSARDALKTTYDCAQSLTESEMEQRAVASFDPNDLIGPAGAGDNRYIAGEGDQLYQVLFENLPAATAPAQRVVVTNQLDTTRFDPATVRFRSIQFGDTVVPLPTPVADVDETVDLRPANDLLVHVTSSVTPAGLIRWTLQAIDPNTLAPPADALSGFLPPNDATHRGEGAVTYTVRLRDLAEATKVTNKASIVFDGNAPIDTPVWSNVIDRSPPTVGVSAAAGADPRTATVHWTGTDAASGVERWDITVSKDGGAPALWHSSQSSGSKAFTASEPGTYAFRAVAHDGAGNTTQSSQSAVVLSNTVSQPKDQPAQPATSTQADLIREQAPGLAGSGPQAATNPAPSVPPASKVSAPSTAKRVSRACTAARAKRVAVAKRIARTKKAMKKAHGAERRKLAKRLKSKTKELKRIAADAHKAC